jgi:hypothetical protein
MQTQTQTDLHQQHDELVLEQYLLDENDETHLILQQIDEIEIIDDQTVIEHDEHDELEVLEEMVNQDEDDEVDEVLDFIILISFYNMKVSILQDFQAIRAGTHKLEKID